MCKYNDCNTYVAVTLIFTGNTIIELVLSLIIILLNYTQRISPAETLKPQHYRKVRISRCALRYL